MADTDLKSRIGKTASAAVAAVLSAFMYMAFNYIAAIGAAVILLLAVRLVIYKKELKSCRPMFITGRVTVTTSPALAFAGIFTPPCSRRISWRTETV